MNILSLFDSSPVGLEGFDLRSAPGLRSASVGSKQVPLALRTGAKQVPQAPSTLSRTCTKSVGLEGFDLRFTSVSIVYLFSRQIDRFK